MRQKTHRSPRTSSPVHRRAFRPVLSWLEGRTLLSGNPTYFTVNLTSDSGTSSGADATTGYPSGDLLWAITQANSNMNPAGSVIDFDPTVFATPQTITLSGTLELSEPAGPEVIQGPGANVLTISGGNAVGVFQVDTATTALLSGLTISGGSATNGGGINNAGTLTVIGGTITGNFAGNSGGGISNSGALTISGGIITSNGTANRGGGISNSGKLTITDSTIAGDDASSTNAGVTIGSGGGLYDSGTVSVRSSAITGNNAIKGGGIYVASGSVTITDSTIADNALCCTQVNGGGIYNLGTLTAVNATIAYNTNLLLPGPTPDVDVGGAGLYDGTGGLAILENTLIANNYDSGYDFTVSLPADIGGTPVSPGSATT